MVIVRQCESKEVRELGGHVMSPCGDEIASQ